MAAIFAANVLCCMFILGMTSWKRAVHKAAQVALAASSVGAGAGEVSRHSYGSRLVAGKSEAA